MAVAQQDFTLQTELFESSRQLCIFLVDQRLFEGTVKGEDGSNVVQLFNWKV